MTLNIQYEWKNTFKRVSAVEDKRANLHIFVALMWMLILKGLLFFCHLGFTRELPEEWGERGGGDNVREVLD